MADEMEDAQRLKIDATYGRNPTEEDEEEEEEEDMESLSIRLTELEFDTDSKIDALTTIVEKLIQRVTELERG